ncbi:apoptosis-antagonizing transcription factor [Xylaria bambusicola]|uniref:apoptosis-antagonizing transcription factor n=1 Tax=Xylaria bambusicola TaxID=326684 RepID=UPI002008D036|nr:apoptosis-antagonizing transcription factor [Xylaria bambusicola]KAI0515038.1 apoptosis-antagonizing transcription factor [Xylaria bambusicola]
MVRKHGRARELADLVERPVKDYDPESNVVPSDDDQSGDESSDNEPVGTEHYVAVGKSKLRRNEPLNLGPQYRGTRVSREALEAEDDGEHLDEDEDEEEEEEEAEDDDDDDISSDDYEDAREQFDDPDAANLEADQQGQEDDEIDSDAIVGEEDWEEFKKFANARSKSTFKENGRAKRPTAVDFMKSDSEDEDEEEGEEDEDEDSGDEEGSSDDLRTSGFIDDEAEESDDDEPGFSDEEDGLSDDGSADDSDDSDGEEDEDEEEQNDGQKKLKRSTDSGIAASVKEMMGEQSVVKSLLRTVDADVQKGKAVQRQRKGFDTLLNIRIRLQKSIVAINSFNYVDKPEDQTTEPYEAAERSALQLWNALDDFRTSIHKGKKRKHAETDDASITALWDRMEVHEKYQSARRKQVLEKWSRDAKKTSITAGSGNKFTRNTEKPLTAMLSAELDAPERLIKRTRTPRSCAPYHVAQKINEDESIYDDADFYQLLLKELVDQRSGDGSGTGLQAATVRYAAAKEAKAKRHVDTKASKGRKMRFAPLPKLQNFMAPEDRRGWEQGAIDRFFGTLFGQKMVLNEEEAESSDEEMGGVSVEDQGLRLFRN